MIKDARSFSHCLQSQAVNRFELLNLFINKTSFNSLNIFTKDIFSKYIYAKNIYSGLGNTKYCQTYYFFSALGLICLICSLSFIFSGCAVLKSIDKVHSDKKKLELGETAFMEQNYQNAESLFCDVIENTKYPWDKNRAVYNLACTKIITAKNELEFIEAVEILKSWQDSKNLSMHYENPKLIVTALIKSGYLLQDRDDDFRDFSAIEEMHIIKDLDNIKKDSANHIDSEFEPLIREQDGKIKTLNNIVRKQNEKIKLLNAIFKKEAKVKDEILKENREMAKTIKTLKHQISELETIDRKLQNKRKTE